MSVHVCKCVLWFKGHAQISLQRACTKCTSLKKPKQAPLIDSTREKEAVENLLGNYLTSQN